MLESLEKFRKKSFKYGLTIVSLKKTGNMRWQNICLTAKPKLSRLCCLNVIDCFKHWCHSLRKSDVPTEEHSDRQTENTTEIDYFTCTEICITRFQPGSQAVLLSGGKHYREVRLF